MTTIISGYTRENRKPTLQHRSDQKDKYLPDLSEDEKYTKLGEKGQLRVRCGYMKPMEEGFLCSEEYTGLAKSKTKINQSVHGPNGPPTRIIVANHGGNLAGAVVLNSADRYACLPCIIKALDSMGD